MDLNSGCYNCIKLLDEALSCHICFPLDTGVFKYRQTVTCKSMIFGQHHASQLTLASLIFFSKPRVLNLSGKPIRLSRMTRKPYNN